MKKRIAILASGTGSNAEKIMEHFKDASIAEIALVLSNRANAAVLDKANRRNVSTEMLTNTEAANGEKLLAVLNEYAIDFVVLAGYMRLIPLEVAQYFEGRMVNIHPALLPKYGGKGMFGDHVHKAVIANGERESGITIHYVNEIYDDGTIIFQATCPVDSGDDANSLASKIHQLEHAHYPAVVEKLVKGL